MRIGLLGLLVLSSFAGVAQGEYVTRTRVRFDPLAVPTTAPTTPIPSVVDTTTNPIPGTSESVATSVTGTGVNSTVGGWVPSTTTTSTAVGTPVYSSTRTRVRYGSTPAPVITPPVVAIEPALVGTPEPGSIALMAGGLGALILLRRRRS